jgi:cell division protein FtsN
MRIEGNNSPAHQERERLTYKDYKAEQKIKNRKQAIMMFLSIFAVLVLIFLGVAKLMSPDVDISLGDDSKTEQEEYNRGIDSRLKILQEDDDMNLTEHDKDDSLVEEDGVVKIPKTEDKSFKPLEDEEPVITAKEEESAEKIDKQETHHNPISPDAAPTSLKNNASNNVNVHPTPAATAAKTYRVYVGMYSTQSQAEVARGILQESGMGLTPTIKQAAGGYTLQVGAFSSKETATNLSNKLLINNYPARVVSD